MIKGKLLCSAPQKPREADVIHVSFGLAGLFKGPDPLKALEKKKGFLFLPDAWGEEYRLFSLRQGVCIDLARSGAGASDLKATTEASGTRRSVATAAVGGLDSTGNQIHSEFGRQANIQHIGR